MKLIQSLRSIKSRVLELSGDSTDLYEAAKLFGDLELIVARLEALNCRKVMERKW